MNTVVKYVIGLYFLIVMHYFYSDPISRSQETFEVVIFRAQKPKAPVTYCDHALSGVRRLSSAVRPSSVRQFTFSTSPESLDGF